MPTPTRTVSIFDTLAREHPDVHPGASSTSSGRATYRRRGPSLVLLLLWFGVADLILLGAWYTRQAPPGALPTTSETAPRGPARVADATPSVPELAVGEDESLRSIPPTFRSPSTTTPNPLSATSAARADAVSPLVPPGLPPHSASGSVSLPPAAETSLTHPAPVRKPRPTVASETNRVETVSSTRPTSPRIAAAETSGSPPPIASEPARHKARRLPSSPIAVPHGVLSRARGTIVLRLHIDAAGRVREARVLRGIDPELDEIARSAAGTWRYEPALVEGVPVEERRNVALRFGDPAPGEASSSSDETSAS